MEKLYLTLTVMIIAIANLSALDLKTIDGRIIKNVKVQNITPDHVDVNYVNEKGITVLKGYSFDQLSVESRKALGFNKEEALKYRNHQLALNDKRKETELREQIKKELTKKFEAKYSETIKNLQTENSALKQQVSDLVKNMAQIEEVNNKNNNNNEDDDDVNSNYLYNPYLLPYHRYHPKFRPPKPRPPRPKPQIKPLRRI